VSARNASTHTPFLVVRPYLDPTLASFEDFLRSVKGERSLGGHHLDVDSRVL
jgi:hypothetical protein